MCFLFFFFLIFQRKAVRSGAWVIQPISLSLGAYGEVEVPRVPPAERPWGLLCSCLMTVTEEGLK